MKLISRLLLLVCSALVTVSAMAGTITVTSPTDGSFVGSSNAIKFNITNASLEVTVSALITGPGGSTTVSDKFTPDADGKINSQVPLNFSNSSPEGAYTIQVTATEPNAVYNTPPLIHVTLDVTAPKLLEFSPNDGQFVKGIVPIVVRLTEPNIKDWRVQINGQDIPNNTGTSQSFTVSWDTSGILTDGAQTINIRIRDLAGNETDKSISVTLDRQAPVTTIATPRSDTTFVPHQILNVIIDITDAGNGSIDATGVDVLLYDLNNNFVLRVPRLSASGSGNTLRWVGRIRGKASLPAGFIIKVHAVDRAGNVATEQTVKIITGRHR